MVDEDAHLPVRENLLQSALQILCEGLVVGDGKVRNYVEGQEVPLFVVIEAMDLTDLIYAGKCLNNSSL